MTRCELCDRMAHRTEIDHFPVPQSLGGKHTWNICRDCHDLKDRVTLANWDMQAAYSAMARVWAKCDPLEKLVICKMLHVTGQAIAAVHALEEKLR